MRKKRRAGPPTRKGQLVQLQWMDWKHGPGKVIKFLSRGDNAVVLVKWPRKGKRMTHARKFLRGVES